MGKAVLHKEEYWVLKRKGRYMVGGIWQKISPVDATRFYTKEHAMNTASRWEGYDDIKIVKCTLEVREE